MSEFFGLIVVGVIVAIFFFMGISYPVMLHMESSRCEETNDVYECERIYVPVEK
jgi:hypothetical protein